VGWPGVWLVSWRPVRSLAGWPLGLGVCRRPARRLTGVSHRGISAMGSLVGDLTESMMNAGCRGGRIPETPFWPHGAAIH